MLSQRLTHFPFRLQNTFYLGRIKAYYLKSVSLCSFSAVIFHRKILISLSTLRKSESITLQTVSIQVFGLGLCDIVPKLQSVIWLEEMANFDAFQYPPNNLGRNYLQEIENKILNDKHM